MNKTIYRIIIALFGFILFIIPLLFWGHLYQVGGDDTRLYYIFPHEILTHYVMNIVSNNTLGVNAGYGPMSFFVPILLVILGVKTLLPFINTQLFLYGANLAFGFLFFYLFTGLWIHEKEDNVSIFSARIVSSLFYILSLFVIKTIFSAQLLAIYTLSVFPAVFYLFIRSVKENNIYLVILSVVVYSAFSSTLLTVPWFGAMAFASIPILIVVAKNNISCFIKMTLIFLVLFIGLNFYWLFHQLYPLIVRGGSGTLQYVSSNTLKSNNIDLIQALSHLNTPIHQMAAYLRSSWSDRNNLGFSQSYGVIYMIVILLGGVFLSKGEKKYGGLYILSVVGLLFSLLLVTPDFGDWNVNLFIFFNNHIPLFTIFRNMYDKFGIAVSFQFAFALFIALVILGEKIHRKSLRVLIILLLTGITVWNAHMYIFSDKSADGISGVFNEDYISLIGYVKSMNEASRFVWLPLNFSSYSVIEDAKNPGRFYYGSSPLQFLAETSDYTGFQSFATAADSDLNFQMLGLIHEKKYDEIGKILQRMNAKYIINYHYAIPKQFYNHMNFEGAIDQQASGMLNELKGEKIRDFGGRYTLYSINVKYHSEKIFLTDTFDTFPDTFTGLTFQKISPSRFDIVVNNQSELIHIAFLEPFDPLWQLSAVDRDGNLCHIPNLQQMMIYRYGNGWTVSKDALVNACPNAFQTNANENEMLSLRVTFKAEKYSSSVNIVSIVCWIIVVVYLVGVGGYSMIKHKKHGKK